MNDPAYVSSELVHFVGRSAASDEAAFSRLIKIINEGWLLTPEARAIGDDSEDAAQFHSLGQKA